MTYHTHRNIDTHTVADPGFPIGGGMDLIGGGVDSRGGYVLKILYVKTKELGPLGGVCWVCPPRSANDTETYTHRYRYHFLPQLAKIITLKRKSK